MRCQFKSKHIYYTSYQIRSLSPINKNYWQIVLAGARKAGKDLNANVPQLGAQCESDINGQISILENAVSEKPAELPTSLVFFIRGLKLLDHAIS